MKYLSCYKKGEYLPFTTFPAEVDPRQSPIKSAAVFFAVYNKQEVLANTIYSVMRQKTSMPLQLCIADDCSDTDITPIVKKYAPRAKLLRYNERQGFDIVMWQTLTMPGFMPDVEAVILMSADILISDSHIINEMLKYVEDGRPVVAKVMNAAHIEDATTEEGFDQYVDHIKTSWTVIPPAIRANKDRPIYSFLMALTMNDMKEVITGEPMCDNILHFKMVDAGFVPLFLEDCIGIHQPHSASWLPCTRLDTCRLTCKLRRHFEESK